jgi:hypothetical protein
MKQQLIEILKQVLTEQPKQDCGCGCGGDCSKPVRLNESKQYDAPISEGLRYHVNNKLSLQESIYRPGSKAHIELIHEARLLWKQGVINLSGIDKQLFENTDLGKFGIYESQVIPLDFPIMIHENLTEEELEEEKKQPALGKPKRGGSKKFYVYVKDPKTKRIKKVSFGMAGGGLRAKLNNPKARQAFSKRHDCPNKKDRTKASYWSCRLPRYARLLGFKTTFSGYW